MSDHTPTAKPPISFPLLAAITVALTLASFALRLWLIEPLDSTITPKGLAALPFAAIFALGVSTVIALAHANQHRWRVVFWWSRGRMIGAVALAFVTPIIVFSWAPWIVGGAAVYFTALALTQPGFQVGVAIACLAVLTGLTVFWYPISCLIVSGLASRWARVAVFCLMFWTAYSTVILVLGNRIFTL